MNKTSNKFFKAKFKFFNRSRMRITLNNGKKYLFKINDYKYHPSNVIQMNSNNILIIAHDYCTQSNGNYSFYYHDKKIYL